MERGKLLEALEGSHIEVIMKEKKIMSQYLRNGSSAYAELDLRGSFIMECAGISPHTPACADVIQQRKLNFWGTTSTYWIFILTQIKFLLDYFSKTISDMNKYEIAILSHHVWFLETTV